MSSAALYHPDDVQVLLDLIAKKATTAAEAHAIVLYATEALKSKLAAELPEKEATVFKALSALAVREVETVGTSCWSCKKGV